MQAANCIVRFFQAGHIFLIQNTSRHSPHDKNGLFISDGGNETPLPPIAARLAVDDFAPIGNDRDAPVGLSWGGMDPAYFLVEGRRGLLRRHRSRAIPGGRTLRADVHLAGEEEREGAPPGYAELHGRRWHADQGDHRFTLVSGSDVPMTCEEETDQGAAAPFVLRQRWAGEARTGAEVSFQNLFYVRGLADPVKLDLRRKDDRSALLLSGGAAIAWCGVALSGDSAWLPGAIVVAESAWVGPGILAFAGASSLALPGAGWKIDGSRPVGLLLDLAGAMLTLRPDSPAGGGVKVALVIGAWRQELVLTEAVSLALPAEACARLAQELKTWLAQTAIPVPAPSPIQRIEKDRGWGSNWTHAGGTGLPERLRQIRVTANPLPIDGFAEQLIDAILPESRETWRQWPAADRYEITLTLPEPRMISTVNILGDCVDDPTLRSFCPLPEESGLRRWMAPGRPGFAPSAPAPIGITSGTGTRKTASRPAPRPSEAGRAPSGSRSPPRPAGGPWSCMRSRFSATGRSLPP